MRTDTDAIMWLTLIGGTLAMMGTGAFVVVFLMLGVPVGAPIIAALAFLYQVWNTYDTFVVHKCWTLYLEEVK